MWAELRERDAWEFLLLYEAPVGEKWGLLCPNHPQKEKSVFEFWDELNIQVDAWNLDLVAQVATWLQIFFSGHPTCDLCLCKLYSHIYIYIPKYTFQVFLDDVVKY